MKHHEFATSVKTTLENDIKKCLIETEHISPQHCIILQSQTVTLYPNLSYKGTFKVISQDEMTMGEFRAGVTSYGLTHSIFNKKPLYNLRVVYDGESIFNKGSIFNCKYIRIPLFNP